MRTALVVLLMAVCGCDCGTSIKQVPECDINPNAAGCKPAPPQHSNPPPATPCGNGTVTGVVCAPSFSVVSGATVTVSGTCEGTAFSQTTTTSSSGDYTLTVPAGSWTLDITSGSFSTMVPVTVTANQTTNLPVNPTTCFPPTIPLAVVTGAGDQIETLLTTGSAGSTGLGFTPTLYDGTITGWPTGGLPFLKNLTEMETYKVIFIDCAAGRTEETYPDGGTSYEEFFFGPDAATITANLQAFVQNGGSIYASDWAMIFIYMGWSTEFDWSTDGTAIAFPFDPYHLEGGADQTVSATVVDMGLASYLQGLNLIATTASPVTITFPTNMSHWGFLSEVNSPATPLITGSVGECNANADCHDAGPAKGNVPLAALYQVSGGGAVAYTSFHNINQTNPAQVEGILKYIVFKL